MGNGATPRRQCSRPSSTLQNDSPDLLSLPTGAKLSTKCIILSRVEMADTEQVAVIRDKGVTEWNNWREADWGVVGDLRGADLRRAHLSGAALIGTNLENASKRNPISRG